MRHIWIMEGTCQRRFSDADAIAVRIVDDSPQDGGGPIIHDVKIKVDDVSRTEIQLQIILDDLRNELRTAVTSKSQKDYSNAPEWNCFIQEQTDGQSAPFTQVTLYERIPKYLDYPYMRDYISGSNTMEITMNFNPELGKEYYKYIDPGGKPFQVNGNEYVVYLFDLSSIKNEVKSVQAEITVVNDYKIKVAEIFTKQVVGGHAKVESYFDWYKSTFWKTMAQADGNIKDSSNLRTVTVDFGWEVGNTTYGFDAHLNYLGFKMDGEYVNKTHLYSLTESPVPDHRW